MQKSTTKGKRKAAPHDCDNPSASEVQSNCSLANFSNNPRSLKVLAKEINSDFDDEQSMISSKSKGGGTKRYIHCALKLCKCTRRRIRNDHIKKDHKDMAMPNLKLDVVSCEWVKGTHC